MAYRNAIFGTLGFNIAADAPRVDAVLTAADEKRIDAEKPARPEPPFRRFLRRQHRVQSKLLASFVAVVVLLLLIATVAYSGLASVRAAQHRLVVQNFAVTNGVTQLRANLNAERQDISLLLNLPREQSTPWRADMDARLREDEGILQRLRPLLANHPATRRPFAQLVALRTAFEETRREELTLLDEHGDVAAARALYLGIQTERHLRLRQIARYLERFATNEANAILAESDHRARILLGVLLGTGGLSLAGATAVGFLMYGAIGAYIADRARAEDALRRNEAALRHANRALRATSGCNQAIVHAQDESALLHEVCRVIVSDAGYRMAWIGVPLDDAEGTVQPVASAGAELGYLQTAHITWRDEVRGRGPTGTAIRTRQSQRCRDMVNDPQFAPWREEARRRGYASSLVLPLQTSGKILGALSIYATEPDAFDTGETHWLEGLADDVTYGITTLREREQRRRAEEEVRRFTLELKRSNEELERFAYVASHDLQEPLRTVSSFSQLLADRYAGRLGTDADEFIAFIVGGASRMQKLINDLLAFSRVGTRGKPLAAVDMNGVLAATLGNLAAAIADTGAVVTQDFLPRVLADATQVAQVLQNLVGNALKFRQAAVPPRIHVSATRSGDQWEFSVRDNGIGIDPQYFERIFVIFQRLHGLNDYPGTGIGLAICKKIIERHGGRMRVESQPGAGATFFFTLQAADEST